MNKIEMGLLCLLLVVTLFPSKTWAKENKFEYGAKPEDGGLSFLGLPNSDFTEKLVGRDEISPSPAVEKVSHSFLEIALSSYEVQTADGFSTTIAWGTPLYLIASSMEKGLKNAYPATSLTFQGELTPAGELAEQALHEVLAAIEGKCQPYAGTLFTEYFSDWAQKSAQKLSTGGCFTEKAFLFPNDFQKLAEGAIGALFQSTAMVINEAGYQGIPQERQEVISQLDSVARQRVLEEEFHKFRYYLSISEFLGAYAKYLGLSKKGETLMMAKATWKKANDAYQFMKKFSDFKPVR